MRKLQISSPNKFVEWLVCNYFYISATAGDLSLFFFYNLARSYDACLGATYAKNDLLRMSHISFIHAHMNHFSKIAVGKLFFLVSYSCFHKTMFFPRQLIDLKASNFEFLFWFFPSACLQKTTTNIQNLTSPNGWPTEGIMYLYMLL